MIHTVKINDSFPSGKRLIRSVYICRIKRKNYLSNSQLRGQYSNRTKL